MKRGDAANVGRDKGMNGLQPLMLLSGRGFARTEARRVLVALGVLFTVVCPLRGTAQTATVVQQFNDWTLYSAEDAGKKLCFVASQPKESQFKGEGRESVYFYVSAWPEDGVKAEVSAKLGFQPRQGTDPTVGVGGASFRLTAKDDRVFVMDATAELKLLEAMKKGAKLVVRSTNDRGLSAVDSYSLSGVGQALQALNTSCQ